MTRIVLDTNVIVSALVFGGLPRNVLELVEAGQCELFHSRPIQAEVRRALEDKFDWAPAMLNGVMSVVWGIGNWSSLKSKLTQSPMIPTITEFWNAL